MRTPFAWTLPSRTSLQVVCACYALWGAPVAGLTAPEKIMPMPAVSTRAPAAPTSMPNHAARIRGVLFNRRVLTLVAMGCLVGTIVGWVRRGSRETRFRLLNKPRKMRLSVLVSPTPVFGLLCALLADPAGAESERRRQ